MELFSSIALAAEKMLETAGGEVAKDAVEFGMAGKEVAEANNISFGKFVAGNKALLPDKLVTVYDKKQADIPVSGSEISFGSLANGEFKDNPNYISWEDGVSANELTEKYMQELTDEICDIYGVDKLLTYEVPGFNNAGINQKLNWFGYGPDYIRNNANEYGRDYVLGTIAHEVGHEVVSELGFDFKSKLFDIKSVDKLAKKVGIDGISPYMDEACADYIAGLTTRLCNLDPTHSLEWYLDRSPITRDGIHPGSALRTEAFKRGYTRIDRGPEAETIKTFEKFSPYDLDKVYQNKDLLKQILEEDILNPIRNGELERV